MITRTILLTLIFAAAAPAHAQSLFRTVPPPPPVTGERVDPAATLYSTSMLVVQPPEPETIKLHDQVTIIVDEVSSSKSEHNVTTDKEYDLDAHLSQFPDLSALFTDATLKNGIGEPIKLDVGSKQEFEGEGKYVRKDRFTAKITATVIDVKPNGILVLEARKYIEKDQETTTIVLSGSCRDKDVTRNNTVLSSQLADLSLISRNEGQIKDAGTKGFIPRVLEAIFAF